MLFIRRRSSGFTLIELLVVVAIIGILGALSIPAVNMVVRKSNQMECANVLRNVYQGIQLYSVDNDGKLPGPSWSTLSAGYHSSDNTHLSGHIAPYLGYPETTVWTRMDSLVPKAYAKAAKLPDSDVNPKIYRINSTDYASDFKRPFGYSGSWGSATPEDLNAKKILNLENPAEEWMLRNLDVNGQPIHKTVRNYLYFDGHVEPQPLTYLPNIS